MVVPIRNERDNVAELIERLDRLAPSLVLEIVFVDDSDDDTSAVVERASESCRHRVRLIHRPPAIAATASAAR